LGRSVSARNGNRRGRRPSRNAPDPGIEERIVFAETGDGLDLRGALIRPAGAAAPSGPLLLWVHTRQQGFAEPEYVTIGRLMAARGWHFLTVETRGHDFGAWFRTPDGPVLQGSAWERFSDCVLDLDAWVEAARDMGYDRLVLAGHGFGGAKVLQFQAQRQAPEVAAVVLASSGSSVRDKLPQHLSELAQRMVAEGRGLDLLPWSTGEDNYASTVSAEYYVSRSIMRKELYGTPALPPAIARVRCPVIAWFGRQEDRPNRRVAEFLDWLSANAVQAPVVDAQLIDGLHFFYKGREKAVVEHLAASLRRVGLAPGRAPEAA
jgi:alpha-beta hydrolase superfamily lysophospholipase